MIPSLKNYIQEKLGARIKTVTAISGGDISNAYLIDTSTNQFFCKINENLDAVEMFQAESEGLKEIATSKSIAVPEVIFTDQLNKSAFLILEYIEPGTPNQKAIGKFGQQLAALHQVSNKGFGWSQDNFIGSLSQSNKAHSDWPEFYWEERILPQLKLSFELGYYLESEIPNKERAILDLSNIFENPKASLLHGDLWSGNYLISKDGVPYLIDPAVYYGHNLVDISMTKLFGGFGEAFYNAYFEVHEHPSKAQIDIYQLYFLLVHLNLFGRSYFASVKKIMKRYFGN